MPKSLEDLIGLLAKIVPILGLVGAGAGILLGTYGHWVYSGFASHHGISTLERDLFDTALLQKWGFEVVLGPMNRIMGHFGLIILSILIFLAASYCLIKYLPSLLKRQLWRILIIYGILSILILVKTSEFIFALSLTLFLLLALIHLILGTTDYKTNTREQNILHIVCCIVLVLVILLVPNVYGRAYFSPEVWCFDADPQEKTIWTQGEMVIIYFSPPYKPKFTIGYLNRPNSSSVRTLVVHIQEKTADQDSDKASQEKFIRDGIGMQIRLKTLLTYQFIKASRKNPDASTQTEKFRKIIKGESLPTVRGNYEPEP